MLENNKILSNTSRVWNPDETLALIFEILLETFDILSCFSIVLVSMIS